jgi:hypothetical protein
MGVRPVGPKIHADGLWSLVPIRRFETMTSMGLCTSRSPGIRTHQRLALLEEGGEVSPRRGRPLRVTDVHIDHEEEKHSTMHKGEDS